jgi:casein kinase II subunit beta
MALRSNRASTARTLRIGGFKIFHGPCKSCPVVVQPWIKQFCAQPQYSWYCEVDRDFAGDWFNHYGMKRLVEHFDEALELLTDAHSPAWADLDEDAIAAVHEQAVALYGLIHARWILQPHGLALMREKYEAGAFGRCPRYRCRGQALLPVGESHLPGRHSAKVFCPRCCDLYAPEGARVDGAHFGTAFPHLFLVEFPRFDARAQFEEFAPTIFGFPVFQPPERFLAHALDRESASYSDAREEEADG